MSKRVRGTRRSSTRPANRPARPAAAVTIAAANQLTDAAQPNAVPATTSSATTATATRAQAPLPRTGPARQSALAARAATEYVYVGQDLRHIGLLAAAIGIVLAILWVIIDVLRVIQL